MKRIFSFIAVLAIIFTLAIPVFAYSTDGYPLKGEWYFYDDLDHEIIYSQEYIYIPLNFTTTINYAGEDITAFCTGIKIGFGQMMYDVVSTSPDMGETSLYVVYDMDVGWNVLFDGSQHIDLGNDYQYVNEFTFDFFYDNADPFLSTCDGSACPVTDFDVDGMCDTCGNILAYSVQRDYVPNSFPSSLPVVPLGYDFMTRFVVYEYEGDTIMWALDPYDDQLVASWDFVVSEYGSISLNTYASDFSRVPIRAVKYQLFNGDWEQLSATSSSSILMDTATDVTMVYSTETIYQYDSEVPFFPRPLWMEVETVTKGEMVTMIPKMGQTMMILTVSGVGLLALLILLSIFRKGLLMR